MADPNIVTFQSSENSMTGALDHGKRAPMRSELVEKACEIVPNKPVLINMVSCRVRQLNMGRPPLIKVIGRMGQADIALTEIIEGKIVLDDSTNEHVHTD